MRVMYIDEYGESFCFNDHDPDMEQMCEDGTAVRYTFLNEDGRLKMERGDTKEGFVWDE